MKLAMEQFLGGGHSWALSSYDLAREFKQANYQVSLKSTNGLKFFPDDLRSNLVEQLDKTHDLTISYTAPINWSRYCQHSTKNRFAIWCYEFPILPVGFAKHHIHVDKILAPSNFAKDIFVNNQVPENKVEVVPHIVNFNSTVDKVYPLKTKKTYKILVNIGQAHLRKNIPNMFRAYFKAFSAKDDVCLVAKIVKNQLKSAFDVDPLKIFSEVRKEFKSPAEVELITNFIPNLAELYHACDIVYTLSYAEAFYLCGLEALQCGKIVIAPRYGGQLDYLNDQNSLLIDGTMIRAPQQMQYWQGSFYNQIFNSDLQQAAEKLQYAVENCQTLTEQYNKVKQLDQFSGFNIRKKIENLII